MPVLSMIARARSGAQERPRPPSGRGRPEQDRNERAIVHPKIMEGLLRRLIETDPQNMDLKTAWIALQRKLALGEAEAGRRRAAADRLECACKAINELLCFDPTNETWIRQRDRLDADISKLALIIA